MGVTAAALGGPGAGDPINATQHLRDLGQSLWLDHITRGLLETGALARCEDLFFDLALEDLGRAADLFRPIHEATGGRDGWVSLEVSPLLAEDAAGTVDAARQLHARAQRSNPFIKIPGTRAGLPAIEEAIFGGAAAFAKSWEELLSLIVAKSAALAQAGVATSGGRA